MSRDNLKVNRSFNRTKDLPKYINDNAIAQELLLMLATSPNLTKLPHGMQWEMALQRFKRSQRAQERR